MSIDFLVYYKVTDNDFRCYHYPSSEYSYRCQLPQNMSNFYLPKNNKKYVANDQDLKRYAEDLVADRNEILQYTNFDYLAPYMSKDGKPIYRTHSKCIEAYFNMYCRSNEYYQLHEDITIKEHDWMSKCNNGGVMYLKTGIFNSYGYDYKRFYQNIMNDEKFIIPYTHGEPKRLKIIPQSIMVGFYRVNIHTDDENFNKIFMYSKDNVYTHYSLKFALKYQKQFNIRIELIVDGDINAYVYLSTKNKYHDTQCMPFKFVCSKWSSELNKLRDQCSKSNGILKMLSSSVWGHLSRKRAIIRKESDIEKEGLSDKIGFSDDLEYKIVKQSFPDDNGEVFYKLVKTDKIYYYPFRLKPFITSYGRCIIGETAIKMGLENVIKIHTDGICLTKPCDTYTELSNNLVPEEKSTGKLYFKRINQPLEPVQ